MNVLGDLMGLVCLDLPIQLPLPRADLVVMTEVLEHLKSPVAVDIANFEIGMYDEYRWLRPLLRWRPDFARGLYFKVVFPATMSCQAAVQS